MVQGTLKQGSVVVLDLNFEGVGRGEAVLNVQLEESPRHDCLGIAICVAKHGRIPDPKVQGMHWASGLACPHQEDNAIGWQCRIQAHRWIYATDEASAVLVLDTQSPVPPVKPPDAFHSDCESRNACLSLTQTHGSCGTSAGEVATFVAKLTFISETSKLPDELRLAHEAFYNGFADVNFLEVSDAGVEMLGREGDLQLTFGFMHFVAFVEFLRKVVCPQAGELFVDLGSGAGHAVVGTALAFPELRGCTGYEIVPTLHDAAKTCASSVHCRTAPMDFVEGDFLSDEVDWYDADIVWIHSLAFDAKLLRRIAEKALKLKPGTRIITMSENFAEGLHGFQKLSSERHFVETNYGDAELYVLRRTCVS